MKFSFVTLKVENKNAVRILGELRRKKVRVRGVKLYKNGFILTINEQDKPKFQEVAAVYLFEYEIIGYGGLKRGTLAVRKHAFLILGLIIGIIAVAIISQFVLKVEIDCDDKSYIGVIERLIQENGADIFTAKSDLDYGKLERLIVESIREVSFANVYMQGVCLKVNAVTATIPEEGDKGADSVLSVTDGIVTRVLVSSGTALVKAGDRVSKGDVLIAGYYITDKDEWGEITEEDKSPAAAKGEIYGKVYYSKRINLPDKAVITRKTGEVCKKREIRVGDYTVGGAAKAPYERYETVVKTDYINCLIPIKVITYTYYEVVDEYVDKAEYRERMIAMARAELTESMPHGSIVLNSWIYDKNGAVDVYYEVEQRLDNGGY